MECGKVIIELLMQVEFLLYFNVFGICGGQLHGNVYVQTAHIFLIFPELDSSRQQVP